MEKENEIMLQCFEWFLDIKEGLWNQIIKEADKLKNLGITSVWLPPACKGYVGRNDVGYGVYDVYDLGEFDQCGTVPTKYGTKDEYLRAIEVLKQNGIKVYADIVLNQKMGADELEEVMAIKCDWEDRTKEGEARIIKAATKFTFPGRNNKYSSFKWNWTHFDGVDYDAITRRTCNF